MVPVFTKFSICIIHNSITSSSRQDRQRDQAATKSAAKSAESSRQRGRVLSEVLVVVRVEDGLVGVGQGQPPSSRRAVGEVPRTPVDGEVGRLLFQ